MVFYATVFIQSDSEWLSVPLHTDLFYAAHPFVMPILDSSYANEIYGTEPIETGCVQKPDNHSGSPCIDLMLCYVLCYGRDSTVVCDRSIVVKMHCKRNVLNNLFRWCTSLG
ncbi:hypothetical protein NQ317_010704 [Molorchus minor]|uniref:Uncharacterized protein n=1 Tax=Molorchus minor TaxID=1323400 RepID=A0ABQ9K7D2_9CUCU|nr:hypothetical protein NQ317_010704 [Molorchus minor]